MSLYPLLFAVLLVSIANTVGFDPFLLTVRKALDACASRQTDVLRRHSRAAVREPR